MGLMERILSLVFGGGQNVVRDTVEVFRENAEGGAVRASELQGKALAQFGAEFAVARRGRFDRFMDGLNRLPRPALALGTLGLFISAMVEPLWFSERMQGIALVPEPMWWLLGVIVSFYFGARHQLKAQEFQRDLVGSIGFVPEVLKNIEAIRALDTGHDADADTAPAAAVFSRVSLSRDVALPAASHPDANAALAEWKAARG
ncbi:holin family protein [Sulfitobacter sp. JB4-11]|uniref:holin family protein n=1 Tax=Sulfitobacter rhodophyticola TaxID=3238304 RepID=UPI003512E446